MKTLIYTTLEDFKNNFEDYYKGKDVEFPIVDNSMNNGGINDTPRNAVVFTNELERNHWNDGFSPCNYGWVIVTQTEMMHKDIISDIDENGMITLHSRNTSPEYQDFQINMNDIHSIWKVIKRTF